MRRKLFDPVDLFAATCDDCGRVLAPTASGYLCCPAGHGKLVIPEADDKPVGGLFNVEGAE